jgi:hypothetical protein
MFSVCVRITLTGSVQAEIDDGEGSESPKSALLMKETGWNGRLLMAPHLMMLDGDGVYNPAMLTSRVYQEQIRLYGSYVMMPTRTKALFMVWFPNPMGIEATGYCLGI